MINAAIFGFCVGCFITAVIEDCRHPSDQQSNKLRNIE